MPDYRRAVHPGGAFFITVVTHQRRRLFVADGVRGKRRAEARLTERIDDADIVAFEILIMPDQVADRRRRMLKDEF